MKIHNGNNIDILKTYPDNYFDSIVTDPPYGIEFLAKAWDSNTGAVETWAECYRVLKPGGYILAFSAARTYHNLATNIEGVGFEIRDQIMWLYASGFPKAQDMGKAIDKRAGKYDDKYGTTTSQTGERGINTHGAKGMGSRRCNKCKNDVAYQYECKDTECGMKYNYGTDLGKQWSGWKTALKPAHEPIVMARKPFKGSCIDNVLTHGVGALNIDATRIKIPEDDKTHQTLSKYKHKLNKSDFGNETNGFGAGGLAGTEKDYYNEQGRFPSNVIGEVTDYQKFFYCPKVSRAERHIGFEQTNIPTTTGGMFDDHGTGKMYSVATDMTTKTENQGIPPNKDFMVEAMGGHWIDDGKGVGMMIHLPHKGKIYVHGLKHEYELWCKANNVTPPQVGNNHPTVKPVELMKYLVKLVTPAGGKVLDPFTGSGSTGMAAVELDYDFTGCELDPAYVNIATQRITAWKAKTDLNNNPLPEQWFTTGE